jgi:hypothetical protein
MLNQNEIPLKLKNLGDLLIPKIGAKLVKRGQDIPLASAGWFAHYDFCQATSDDGGTGFSLLVIARSSPKGSDLISVSFTDEDGLQLLEVSELRGDIDFNRVVSMIEQNLN